MKRALLVGVLGCSGCFLFGGGGRSEDPCEMDRFGCADGELDVDTSCMLEGELVVAVGDGDGAFELLPEGEPPTIVTGPQGGQHTMLGVRIDNPALDHYDELQVHLGIYPASQCPAPENDELLDPCSGSPDGGQRTVVLGDAAPLAVTESGSVREHDLVVFLGPFTEPDMVIEAVVADPCGRRGLARHRMRRP